MTTTKTASPSEKMPFSQETGLMPVGERGIQIRDFENLFRFAKTIVRSGLCPSGITSPEQVVIVVQSGLELGLSPMRSLSWLYPVNGRVAIMGDCAKSLVEGANALEPGTSIKSRYITIEADGTRKPASVESMPDDLAKWPRNFAVECSAHRRGREPMSATFSVGEAMRAGLWMKKGARGPTPWVSDPGRMLQHRAWGRLSRDVFGDILLGMPTTEEAQDLPPVVREVGEVEASTTPAPVEDEPDAILDTIGEESVEPVEAEIVEPSGELCPACGQPEEDHRTVDGEAVCP